MVPVGCILQLCIANGWRNKFLEKTGTALDMTALTLIIGSPPAVPADASMVGTIPTIEASSWPVVEHNASARSVEPGSVTAPELGWDTDLPGSYVGKSSWDEECSKDASQAGDKWYTDAFFPA